MKDVAKESWRVSISTANDVTNGTLKIELKLTSYFTKLNRVQQNTVQ